MTLVEQDAGGVVHTAGLPIELIRTNGGTQMRVELSQEVYLDYRDKWLAGVEFDPITVYFDGSTYWLADGFHRFYGAREAKLATIPAVVHNGTVRDAILHAAGANAQHGLRRTNADKRQAVLALLNDESWCLWSNGMIAERCHVTPQFVGDIRRQLETVSSSPAAKASKKSRVGRDGKRRKATKPVEEVVEPSGIRNTLREWVASKEVVEPVVDGTRCQKSGDGKHAWDDDQDGRFCRNCKEDFDPAYHSDDAVEVKVEPVVEVENVAGGTRWTVAALEAERRYKAKAFASVLASVLDDLERGHITVAKLRGMAVVSLLNKYGLKAKSWGLEVVAKSTAAEPQDDLLAEVEALLNKSLEGKCK